MQYVHLPFVFDFFNMLAHKEKLHNDVEFNKYSHVHIFSIFRK